MDERRDYYQYALYRDDGRIFYIGKGKGNRLSDHEYQARRGKKGHLYNIIRGIHARGAQIIKRKILENLTEAEAHAAEIAMIASFGRYPNGPLANATDGGEGTSGRKYKHLPETRAKISATRIGMLLSVSPETRAKISIGHTGRKHSSETRAKISATLTGRKLSPETRVNMSIGKTGKKLSPEARAKISAAMTAKRQRKG